MKETNTQRSSQSKKLGMALSELNWPSVIVALICAFFFGYSVAVILVPARPGAIVVEAVFGGFFAVFLSRFLIPSMETTFMQFGRFGYAAIFLRSTLEGEKPLVIIAGDLDWIDHPDYEKVMEAFKKRKGKNIHVLCFNPKKLSGIPRKDPKDLRDRINKLFSVGLREENITYHTRDYRGLLLPDLFAIRTEASGLPPYLARWLERRRAKYGLTRPDYMTYHKERELLDTMWSMVSDYCEIAPPKPKAKKTSK